MDALSLEATAAALDLSEGTIVAFVEIGTFPQPVAGAWRRDDVERWRGNRLTTTPGAESKGQWKPPPRRGNGLAHVIRDRKVKRKDAARWGRAA